LKRSNGGACPYCGAILKRGALACSECGSDAETGWASEDDQHDALWTRDDDEDYEEFVRSLPGGGGERVGRRGSCQVTLAVVALIVLIAFLMAYIF
jgi:hypothetical protein